MIIVIFFSLLFCILNLLLAKEDARLILNHQAVNHRKNAVEYCAYVALAMFFSETYYSDIIHLIISLFLTRVLVFDGALNKYRGLDFFYVSRNPTSVVDKIEIKILGKDGKVHFIFYAALFLTNIIMAVI